jgi:membrane fusion protein (multidrug efflux system)
LRIPELGGRKVFVYEDGAAQPRPVETGIRSDTAVQITNGLAEGDLVIISGLLQMQPGLEVEIEEQPVDSGPTS